MTIADWLRNRNYPEFKDGVLVFPPVAVKCAGCHGQLIGGEIRFGTCGACGGRSVCRDGSVLSSARPGEFTKDRP